MLGTSSWALSAESCSLPILLLRIGMCAESWGRAVKAPLVKEKAAACMQHPQPPCGKKGRQEGSRMEQDGMEYTVLLSPGTMAVPNTGQSRMSHRTDQPVLPQLQEAGHRKRSWAAV